MPKPAAVMSERTPEPAPVADPAPDPAPDSSLVGAATAAEFDVEVEGEVFKVRVSGGGLAVMPAGAIASAPASSGPTPPKIGEGTILAPMQGLIVKLPVKPGDEV
jgi:hypothetical protein